MLRNRIIMSLSLGFAVLLYPEFGVADDQCYDRAIKTIDRLKLRLERGTPFSAQEITCQKFQALRAEQAAQDHQYLATQLSDRSFREISDSRQTSVISLDVKQRLEKVTIRISSGQSDGSEKRSVNTLRGFKSINSEH